MTYDYALTCESEYELWHFKAEAQELTYSVCRFAQNQVFNILINNKFTGKKQDGDINVDNTTNLKVPASLLFDHW